MYIVLLVIHICRNPSLIQTLITKLTIIPVANITLILVIHICRNPSLIQTLILKLTLIPVANLTLILIHTPAPDPNTKPM